VDVVAVTRASSRRARGGDSIFGGGDAEVHDASAARNSNVVSRMPSASTLAIAPRFAPSTELEAYADTEDESCDDREAREETRQLSSG
jgi:hypothetical protein